MKLELNILDKLNLAGSERLLRENVLLNDARADQSGLSLGDLRLALRALEAKGQDIVVSDEASTYRPEMEWLAGVLNAEFSAHGKWRVLDAGPRDDWQRNIYRFFELFDLPNVPAAAALMPSPCL